MTCVFCDIIAGEAPARGVIEFDGVTAFHPLNPVVPGHFLVVPNVHVAHAADDPEIAGRVMEVAARIAQDYESANIITSINAAATQTVYHLHLHVVPRFKGDGLKLPWTDQEVAHDNEDSAPEGQR